jgi:hypothetical protein
MKQLVMTANNAAGYIVCIYGIVRSYFEGNGRGLIEPL